MIAESLKKEDARSGPQHAQVIVFPARIPAMQGRQIFFLFSIRQVVEVMGRADVQPVPFGPPYAEGLTEWRDRVVPVLSLERCLGLKTARASMPLRNIVVRSVADDKADQARQAYAVFTVGAAARQLKLPLACRPAEVPDWIVDASCLKGVYEMDANLLLVINIESILNAGLGGS